MIPACLFLLAYCSGTATDEAPKPRSLSEKLESIKKQHKKAEEAYVKAMEELPDTEEGSKQAQTLRESFDKGQAERFVAAVRIAELEGSSNTGVDALEWVLTIPRAYYLPAGIPAMKLVVKYHITNPRIGKLVAWVAYYAPHPDLYPKESAAAKELMRAVAGKNPSKTARGQAYLGLAREAYTRFAVAEYQRASNVEKLAAEAEDAYERLIKKYGDCDWLIREARGTIGDFAKSELYELRHLRIGKVAPEMEAEDLEGRVFMLSDSRGKVTVLVFWATWCGPCMAMVPRERELVARLKDKPFALIGVNGDESREKAKEAATREKMNWRSFWSGPNDSEGSISRAWNVRGWPQVYVLDGKGVIRFKGLRGDQLAEAVDFLLKEMEGK